MGMARMSTVSDRFEQFVEAWDAAAILGRSVSFAPDVARIGDVALAGASIGHGEPMIPAIAEVIIVIDDGFPRLEHVAQAHLARFDARLSPQVAGGFTFTPHFMKKEIPGRRTRACTSLRIASIGGSLAIRCHVKV